MIKKLLVAVLLVGGLAVFGYWYFSYGNLPPGLEKVASSIQPLIQGIPGMVPQSSDQAVSSLKNTAQTIGQQSQHLSQQTQAVLGTAVQVNEESGSSVPERAFNHGQYLYCKQVVEEYEKKLE